MNILNIVTTKLESHVGANSACSSCKVRTFCMPVGASDSLLSKLDDLVLARKRVKAGAILYHSGSHFHALYAVKSGFVKTENLYDDGRAQITGIYMSGEIFGFDGIGTDAHICTSTALEDSEICVIPLNRIEHIGQNSEELQHHFYKLMSREIVRDHTIMMLLGSMRSEERLAAFLLNLSQRYRARGYSPYRIVLRMKRDEIGNYLGMKVETVSRILSKFQDQELLEVHQKDIRILNFEGLKTQIGHYAGK